MRFSCPTSRFYSKRIQFHVYDNFIRGICRKIIKQQQIITNCRMKRNDGKKLFPRVEERVFFYIYIFYFYLCHRIFEICYTFIQYTHDVVFPYMRLAVVVFGCFIIISFAESLQSFISRTDGDGDDDA